jgi:hypothetical protein
MSRSTSANTNGADGRFSRRRWLGGAAVALAVPPFESLLGRAYAQAARKRVVTIFAPNGVYMPQWPRQSAPLEMTPLLAPLEPIKNKVIATNLGNAAAEPPGGAGDHACGAGAAFSCAPPAKADGADIRAGITVDQVAANHLKQFTRVPSVQLGILQGRQSCVEAGYSCLYSNTLSWANEKQPLAPVRDPGAVFDQLFAGFDPAESEAARLARVARRTSVLDYVREEAALLKGKLGRADAAKLDEVVASVRDVEKRLQAPAPGKCGLARPASPDGDFDAKARLVNDLIVAAFQCDATRVASNHIASPFPDVSYRFLGVSRGHHAASHYKGNPGKEADYQRICLWHVQMFADLCSKLNAVREDGGTMLDSTFVVQSSEVGDSNGHSHADTPVLLAGGAPFKGGRSIAYPRGTPLAGLYLAVLGAAGVPATRFGSDGTAPLAGLA